MCGIWLSIGWRAERDAIRAVKHRGPDGEGWQNFFHHGMPIIMGHRRLAIFDTSDTGAQPMSAQSVKCHIVFNGAIYNYIELREELAALGYNSVGTSDTEVLMNSYLAWGEACLDRFNGMFAFVIFDQRKGKIFAARDRFGIKPLYILADKDGIGFASEIKQFMAIGKCSRKANKVPLMNFLLMGQMDYNHETLFHSVTQLRGGECLSIDIDDVLQNGGVDAATKVRHWYGWPRANQDDLSAEDAIEAFHELFFDAVRLRMRSDVGYGFCLSGGLDSSAIVCVARALTDAPLTTITAVFDESYIDERPHAAIVENAVGASKHHTFPDPALLVSELSDIVYHMDGPFPTTSMFAQWCVFKKASEVGLKVTLDGQGADEQLAGYLPAVEIYQRTLLRKARVLQLIIELLAEHKLRGTLSVNRLVRVLVGLLPLGLGADIRQKRIMHNASWLRAGAFENHPQLESGFVDLETHLYRQTFSSSLPALLHYEDRMSMAFGVETRLPFLDYRLVELVMGLGEKFKIQDGETKWILRRAMKDTLPPVIANRHDKIGFATPEDGWFSGELLDLIGDASEYLTEALPDIFNGAELNRYREKAIATDDWSSLTAWRLVTMAEWMRSFSIEDVEG